MVPTWVHAAVAWGAVLALVCQPGAAAGEGEAVGLADLPPSKDTPTPWHKPEEGVVKAVPRNAFPNKLALRGAEGAGLHDANSLITDLKNSGEWEAEEYPYPGNGKMNAADTKQMLDSVRGSLAVIKAAKEADYKHGEAKMAIAKKNADHLIASVSGGAKGTRLLTGAFPQQLGIMKGNVGNCKVRLATCKADAADASTTNVLSDEESVQSEFLEVGESSDPLADLGPDVSLRETKLRPCYTPNCLVDTKRTAVQEYNVQHGETNPFLDAARREPMMKTAYHGTTAYQDYAKSQEVAPWDRLDGEPGMKLPADRLPAGHLKSVVQETAQIINRQEKLDAQEDATDLATVKDAAEKSTSAVIDVGKARMDMIKFHAPKTTDALLAEMAKMTTELNKCMEDVLKHCQDGKPFEVAEAASTMEDVLDKHPNPRDNPDHNPSEGSLSPKVMTKGGDGGSKPISPGQDATDVPQRA